MHKKSALLIKLLLNRYVEKEASMQGLLSRLPAGEAEEVKSQVIEACDPAVVLSPPEEALSWIHYSWLASPLKKIPKPLQLPTLSALPGSQGKKLASLIKQGSLMQISEGPLRVFLQRQLVERLFDTGILPKSFLPKTPLSPLLEKTKVELEELLDFLGIYDLAEEVRHIVDKHLLKKVYAHLSSKKVKFLRYCLHLKERLITPKLSLEKWDGKKTSLDVLLHKRGISRLARALSGHHADTCWCVIHTLDTGRGEMLKKQISTQEVPGVTPLLMQQVVYTINFLGTKAEE